MLYGQDSLKADPVVLLDPNTLSDDGTVALRDAEFSDNGAHLAYSLSSGGSDWSTIKVTLGLVYVTWGLKHACVYGCMQGLLSVPCTRRGEFSRHQSRGLDAEADLCLLTTQ